MRKILLLSILLWPVFAYSQKCVVSNNDLNIFYVGISNRIHVAVDGYSSKSFLLTSDNGTINATDDPNAYDISPLKTGLVTISVISKNSKHTLLAKSYLSVKNIPDPVARVAGKSGGSVPKNVFKAQIGITAILLDVGICGDYIIDTYTVTILRNETALFVKKCNEARFPKEVRDAFGALEINDRVLFTEISCRGVATRMRLQPIEFTIE